MLEKPKIETRIELRLLKDLRLLDPGQNARFMKKRDFDQLVENIRNDGCLTSAPLVYDLDTPGEILSGNHRVQAAIQAGIERADVIVILSTLTKDQKTAIQLSHNRIVGEDDKSVLKMLYESISDIDDKLYSGIADDDFKIDELNICAISFMQAHVEEVVFAFLPEDKEAVLDWLKNVEKIAKKSTVVISDKRDFGKFYDAIVGVKQIKNVLNHATAIRLLCDLAKERLEQLQAETKIVA
jgi:hypothetical protein